MGKKAAKVDVVNPAKLTRDEVEKLDAKTKEEKQVLDLQLKKVNKVIQGKLWLWWLLPIFGWLIYSWLLQNRKNKKEIQVQLIALKRQIAEKEIQLMLDKKRLAQLDESKQQN